MTKGTECGDPPFTWTTTTTTAAETADRDTLLIKDQRNAEINARCKCRQRAGGGGDSTDVR